MNIEDLVVFRDFLLERGYIFLEHQDDYCNRYYSNYTKMFEKTVARNEICIMNGLKFTKPYVGFHGTINNKQREYTIFYKKLEIETLNFNELILLIIEQEKNLLEEIKTFYSFKNEKLWRNNFKKRKKINEPQTNF